MSSWYGLFAPKARAAAPLDILHGAIQAALGGDDIKEDLGRAGAPQMALESRQAFADFVTEEVARWTAIAKVTGIPME